MPAFAVRDLRTACLFVLAGAGGEIGEGAFGLQPGDAFRGRREVQAQGPLHRDLAEAEVRVVEHLADHPLPFDRLPGDRVVLAERARLAVAEGAEDARHVADVVGLVRPVRGVAQLVALVAQALGHLDEEAPRVDELDLALAPRFLAVGHHPEIGRDAGIVEQLVGQGDDGLQPVVLDDPAPDVALAAAGVAREQGRAVEHDGEATAAGLGRAHFRQHVLQEQQRAVVDARQPRAEPAGIAEGLGLVPNRLALLLPLHAEGRVGQHVVEGPRPARVVGPEGVRGEGVAEMDVVRVLALDEHVGLADRPGFVVPVLAEHEGLGVGVEGADVLFGHGQHAAGAAGRVVDGLDDVALAQVAFRGQQQIDHELDDLARGEVLAGLLVGLFGADADEFLEDVAHLHVVHALRGQIDRGEALDHLVEQVLLGHARDLRVEGEPLHDVAHVGREAGDVGVQVGRDVVGVVQQGRQVELGQVVERASGNLVQAELDDRGRFALQRGVCGEDLRLGAGEQAIEAPQHRQREDDLAILVALVGAAEQVADAPDEGRELGVGIGAHSAADPTTPRSPSQVR